MIYPIGRRVLRGWVVVVDWPTISRTAVDLTPDACTTKNEEHEQYFSREINLTNIQPIRARLSAEKIARVK